MDTCRNCLRSVFIEGRWLCVKYGCTVHPDKDTCTSPERRFDNVNTNKTIVHTSEVVVKKS